MRNGIKYVGPAPASGRLTRKYCLFLEIMTKTIEHGKSIRDESGIRCWQYGLIQVCKTEVQEFIFFGMALNISNTNGKIVFHAGNEKCLEDVMNYLSLEGI